MTRIVFSNHQAVQSPHIQPMAQALRDIASMQQVIALILSGPDTLNSGILNTHNHNRKHGDWLSHAGAMPC